MNIPQKARYALIMDKVKSFFEKEEIIEFPIDPFKIIKRNRWALCKYSDLAAKHGVSVTDIVEEFQTEDACVMKSAKNYTIAYNDTVPNAGRIRFSLMHEIGHITLGHLEEFNATAFNRGGLTEDEYDVLEREANAFARNALAPPVVFVMLKRKFGLHLIEDAADCFKLSKSAVKTRIEALNYDLSMISTHSSSIFSRFQGYINSIIDSKHCKNCNHHYISRFTGFCPICSHTKFSKLRGDTKMIYSGHDVDGNCRVKICARCNNEEITDHGEFCQICAAPVVNRCTNVDFDAYGNAIEYCNELAFGNARYCTSCGSETVFFKAGLLKPWDEEQKQIAIEKLRAQPLNLAYSQDKFMIDL